MKLSDYKSDKKSAPGGSGSVDANTKKMLKAALKEFEGKSEDELIRSIVDVATKKRAEGTLTDSELDGFYQMIAPNVNAEQKRKLDLVMKMLKDMK